MGCLSLFILLFIYSKINRVSVPIYLFEGSGGSGKFKKNMLFFTDKASKGVG